MRALWMAVKQSGGGEPEREGWEEEGKEGKQANTGMRQQWEEPGDWVQEELKSQQKLRVRDTTA